MQEIEVKILEIDVPKIETKLRELGAEKILDEDTFSYLYDFEDNRLNKRKELLRLRKIGDNNFITFKHKVKDSEVKSAEEIETNVDDFNTMHEILTRLNLKVRCQVEKHRTSYKLDDVRFEIDKFEDIPAFLEIEATSKEKIREYVEKIGYTMRDTKPWSGADVFKHYGKKI